MTFFGWYLGNFVILCILVLIAYSLSQITKCLRDIVSIMRNKVEADLWRETNQLHEKVSVNDPR